MFTHIQSPPLPDVKEQMTPAGKRFYMTPNGDRYPSITTLLGTKEKPWLNEWKSSLGPTKALQETKRCQHRGTTVHNLIEHYLKNDDITTLLSSANPKDASSFKRLRPNLNKIDNIRAQETALFSNKLKVAGRVDCIGEYNNQLSIIDFKTSTAFKSKQMVFDYYLQTTAYAIMWHELTNEPIEHVAILITTENGFPQIFTDSIDKYVKELLIRIHQFYNRKRT